MLQVHQESREINTLALVVTKSSPKLMAVPLDDKIHGQIRFGMSGKTMQLTGDKAPMSELCIWLTSILGDPTRPVIDRTGLAATYDFRLQWLPDDDFPGVDLSGALQEIGLKLVPVKAPFDFLVIGRIERVPIEN